jgi:hypothetical protein
MMGGDVGHWLHVGRRGEACSSPTAIAGQEVETIRARIRAGVIRIEGSSSCAYVSGNRIGIHMVLVLRRKGRRCEAHL